TAGLPWGLRQLYPRQSSRSIVWWLTAVAFGGGLLALMVPARLFLFTTLLLVANSAPMALYLVVTVWRAARDGERGAPLLILGLVLFIGSIVHDAVLPHLLHTSLIPIGVLSVVLAPGAV